MKKFILISVLLFFFLAYNFFSCKQKTQPTEKILALKLSVQVDSFAALCSKLRVVAESRQPDEKKLQRLFLQTRLAYKSFEWAAEYFEPATSRFVNGPPVPEVEVSGEVFEPAGLQVIETFLFPKYDTARQMELVQQLKLLQSRSIKYKKHFDNIDIFDWQVFDALKLEVFRIITLGIAGFDNPATLKSMAESAVALKSAHAAIDFYIDKSNGEKLPEKFNAAARYLVEHKDFNSFNRAEFIIDYANPITTGLTELEEILKIKITRYNRLLNQDAKTLFDVNAFNVNSYTPDQSSVVTDAKTSLGKVLFSDPGLSGTGTRSCQSCHQPERAFTDGLVKNKMIGNNKFLERNTPTLLNAALQPSQFYDLRANTLEDQALNVVQSTIEMHGSLKASVKKLWEDSTYRQMFSKAFPKKDRTSIDTLEVMNAIGSYVRSLVLLNSRFDEYMRGNKNAMNTEEVNGFNLFMGKAKCATCHYMPLFNGTFPPRYLKIESEVIGVPQSLTKNEIDSDLGRFNIIKTESFRHAFKIQTVRNAARTAPYMHNGVFTTLEEVIDFYNKGGGPGLGIKPGNLTLSPDPLKLSEKERHDIIAFIKSLDSR